jgi:hypothetical protein
MNSNIYQQKTGTILSLVLNSGKRHPSSQGPQEKYAYKKYSLRLGPESATWSRELVGLPRRF